MAAGAYARRVEAVARPLAFGEDQRREGGAPLFGQRREEEEGRVVLEIYKSLGG